MKSHNLLIIALLTAFTFNVTAQTNESNMKTKVNKTEDEWVEELGEEKFYNPS